MQLIVITVFCSVGALAYFGLAKYNSALLPLLGIVAFIAMMFIFMCVSIFMKGYGVSFFSRTRKAFDASAYTYKPTTEIQYVVGRKNTFTGKRNIYVREREVKSGGVLLVLGIPAIIVGIFGIIKFIFEALRVICSDARAQAWEESRAFLTEKIEEDGVIPFFQTPIISVAIFLIVMVISIPVTIATAHRYHPSHVEFQITEKENAQNYNNLTQILFHGTVENNGRAKIEQIEGIVYFKDKNKNILQSRKVAIHVPFSTPSAPDNYLEKDESWDFTLDLRIHHDEDNFDVAQELWNMDLEEIEITMDVTGIRYRTNGIVEFSNRTVMVKPVE